jgi:hypothetical protein
LSNIKFGVNLNVCKILLFLKVVVFNKLIKFSLLKPTPNNLSYFFFKLVANLKFACAIEALFKTGK